MNHCLPIQYPDPGCNVIKDTIINVVLLAKSKPKTLVDDSFRHYANNLYLPYLEFGVGNIHSR